MPRHEYVERMFPEPVDLGHRRGRPGRLDRSAPGTEHLEGAGGEGTSWYAGRRRRSGDQAVQGITIYPPTRGLQTQGDPFEPVKIGILIDMDLGQLLADWIDPTILAIEDALNEGVWRRSPIAARHRRRPGPAPRELPQGHRRATSGWSTRAASSCSAR